MTPVFGWISTTSTANTSTSPFDWNYYLFNSQATTTAVYGNYLNPVPSYWWTLPQRLQRLRVDRIVMPYVRRADNENWRARAEQIAFARGDYDTLTPDQLREIEQQARRMTDQEFARRYDPAPVSIDSRPGPDPAACARARELLLSFLTADQRAEFEATQAFTIIIDGRRYRINRGKVANIEVYSNDNLLHRLCIHPEGYHEMPSEDVMLSQLLHLRSDASGFLARANVHPLTSSVAFLEQVAAMQQRERMTA